MNMNIVILEGRLVRELEYKKSNVNNKNYCSNCIAVDRGKDKEGNKREALFVNFVVWEKNAEYLYKYAKKGGRIILQGRLDQTKDFDYEKNITEYELKVVPTDIRIIDFKEKEEVVSEKTDSEIVMEVANNDDPFEMFGNVEITDDDLPF